MGDSNFVIKVEQVIEGTTSINTHDCDDYDSALNLFNELVDYEVEECWSPAFDKNGNLSSEYTMEADEDYFEIYETDSWELNHTIISIDTSSYY